jgi:3-methylcrotonyl-CoA carboxylase alpha subunit
MPGRVTKLLVEVGQMVQAGAPLVVLEAMKMEQVVTATREGIVESLHVDVGQSVPLGAELLRWRTSAAPQDGEKTRK